MTPKTSQCQVFWALLLNPKHSGVPEDSKSPTLGVLGFTPTLGQSGVATTDLKLRLIASRTKDAYRYNVPMVDEGAALMVGDASEAVDRRDIVVA
jgi:hypothetical protein